MPPQQQREEASRSVNINVRSATVIESPMIKKKEEQKLVGITLQLSFVMKYFHNLIVAPPEPQSNLNSTYLSTRLMARKSPLAESSL